MGNKELLKVFVYGTLKPGEINYPLYCERWVLESKLAYVQGELYHLPSEGYPGLIRGGKWVKGYLLTFPNDRSKLASLDSLEDYDPDRSPEDNLYHREWTAVYDEDRQLISYAWVYFLESDRISQFNGILVENGWWYANYY